MQAQYQLERYSENTKTWLLMSVPTTLANLRKRVFYAPHTYRIIHSKTKRVFEHIQGTRLQAPNV